MSWPEPVERVSTVLRAAAVEARIEEFGDGTPTAREAARAIGCDLSQIVKSLVFVCDGGYVLALVPGDRRADEQAIATAVSASEVRVARAEEVLHATGFEPGGVAPFPLRAVTERLIDKSLFAHEVVWIGAGSASHMALIGPPELKRLAGARAVDLVSHG
ncbi:MAG: YbaK/EbsC family protein [Actinobacteria bacterium]|nr:YbaK/EbsC family protein [Actinomycetota bacterium]